jgi:hypothetical protein
VRRAPVLVLPLLLGACVTTRPSEVACTHAPEDVVEVLQAKVTTPGELRNASLWADDESGYTFVTAELREAEDAEDTNGELLTWVSGDVGGTEFFSVDVYARDHSDWPDAPFGVTADGAVDSRGCASYWVGDH